MKRTRQNTRRHLLFRTAALAGAAAGLSACGFRIRGFDLGLPFKQIAIEGGSGVATELRQIVFGQPGTRIVANKSEAEIVLIIVSEQVDRTVVAFSSAGRPRELQLRMRVVYRVTDRLGIELSPPQEIAQSRDISVSESEALAFARAEEFALNDMQRDIAQQIIPRLRTVRLPAP